MASAARDGAHGGGVALRGAAALALALLVASVAAQPAPTAELRVGVPRLPPALDPATLVAGPDLTLGRLVFQGLVEIGERGDLEPALATQWSVSRDGLVWTFRIRPGVHLHGGEPLTPDDVVAALSRHLAPEEPGAGAPPWARLFRGSARLVREIRPADEGSVQLTLAQPFSPLLAVLAHPALAIATPAVADDRLLGTGPYRVVEHAPTRLVLALAAPAPDDPRPRRVVFAEAPDDAAGIAGLAPGGPLDVYFAQSSPAWAAIGLQVLSAPTWQLGYLAMRTDRGPTARKAVRQAIAAALDPALAHPALGRAAVAHAAYLPPGAWALQAPAAVTHDLTRARRLLGQAGAGEATLTLLAPETPGGAPAGPDAARLAEAIRLSLAAAGLKVDARLGPADTTLALARQGSGDLVLIESALPVNDPDFLLRPLLASDATAAASATNLAFFRSPLVDGMLFRASQIAFRPERLRLYQRLQAHLAEELPYLPLYARLTWVLARPEVRGLRLDPGGLHRLERASLDGRASP